MDDLYRDYILEHYRRPHNFGVIEDADASYEGANPLCGDRITLMLGVKDGIVDRVGFTGRGCAISQASASLLTDEIKGKPVEDVAAIRADDLLDLLGIDISPARLKCAMLSHDSLQHVLGDLGVDGAAPEPTHDPDRAPLQVSGAGLTPARPDPADPPHTPLTALAATPASPSTTGAHPAMPKSYADLLREARAQIREVSPQEVDALPAGAATVVDVREASEWEQGHLPGARHVSKSYIEQQIEGIAPDRDAPVILYCAGGVRSLFAAQTLAEMGYTDVASMSGGFQGWKSAGLEFDTPVVLTAEQKQRYSRHLLIPEVGAEGQAKLLGSKALLIGAGGLGVAGIALPRRGRRRHDRHRRLRRRRPRATSSARSSTRPTGWGSARSNPRGSRSTRSTRR